MRITPKTRICKKIAYTSKESAEYYIDTAKNGHKNKKHKRTKKSQVQKKFCSWWAYKCEICIHWHLTSQDPKKYKGGENE